MALLYIELIGFTAGALLSLFLIALILGNRRPRAFERVLFFLILALFSYYCGVLLVLEAAIHYSEPPPSILAFASMLIEVGLAVLPALLFQAHTEYLRFIEWDNRDRLRIWGWLSYAPVVVVAWQAFRERATLLSLSPGGLDHRLELTFVIWLGISLLASATIELRLARRAAEPFAWLHGILASAFFVICAGVTYFFALGAPSDAHALNDLRMAVAVSGVFPTAVLGYFIVRHNFLGIGVQKNLIYAVSAAFLALLYLGLVRRVSGWLEPILPPEATASILLFVLVIFFEPLERTIGSGMQRTFKRRFDRLQLMFGDFQERARQGDLHALVALVEGRVRDEFGLSVVRLALSGDSASAPLKSPGGLGHIVRVPLRRDGVDDGVLEAASTGAVLTGEV